MNARPTKPELLSVELRFLFDHAILARQQGQHDRSDVFLRAAEGLIRLSLPQLSDDLGSVASRKGVGEQIALRVAQSISPTVAAAIIVLWTFRGARQPAIRVLLQAFGNHPDYQDAVRVLCHRLFATPTRSHFLSTAIEVAAPHAR